LVYDPDRTHIEAEAKAKRRKAALVKQQKEINDRIDNAGQASDKESVLSMALKD
jgi:hypothetical protein